MRSRYGPQRRLQSAAQFDAVFKRGARLGGRLFLVVFAPNPFPFHRLGIAASRRIGGAVARNRARRLLRESFRRASRPAKGGFDVVVVAHRDLAACGQAEVDSELSERIRRIERSAGRIGAPAAPAG